MLDIVTLDSTMTVEQQAEILRKALSTLNSGEARILCQVKIGAKMPLNDKSPATEVEAVHIVIKKPGAAQP